MTKIRWTGVIVFLTILAFLILFLFVKAPRFHSLPKETSLAVPASLQKDDPPLTQPIDHTPISGPITLGELAKEARVPVNVLKRRLGLPGEVSAEDRIAPWSKRLGFEMHDVHQIAKEYQRR